MLRTRNAEVTIPSSHDRIAPSEASGVRRQAKVPFSAENGRAAPLTANAVVAEYARLRRTDPRSRAILGRYAKQLILGGRWHDADLLAAVRAFAHTKRHPRFFEEWVREVVATAEVKAHEESKQSADLPRSSSLRRLDVDALLRKLA